MQLITRITITKTKTRKKIIVIVATVIAVYFGLALIPYVQELYYYGTIDKKQIDRKLIVRDSYQLKQVGLHELKQ